MGRKPIATEGILGSLSMNKEIEMMVQILGWTDDEILKSIQLKHPKANADDTLNHIRVSRSKFRKEKEENASLSGILGNGGISAFGAITAKKVERFVCGINNIDLLWGYGDEGKDIGFPRGQVSLLGGSPGVGKTRAMIAVCGALTDPTSESPKKAIYWQNEFDLGFFKTMAEGKIHKEVGDNFHLGNYRSLQMQLDKMSLYKPDLVVVDSYQMIDEAKGKNGVSRCLGAYKNYASENGCHVVLIGQLNKKNQIAGTRELEHLVDSTFRAFRDKSTGGFVIDCEKNRWGKSNIRGYFRHIKSGIEPFGKIQMIVEDTEK